MNYEVGIIVVHYGDERLTHNCVKSIMNNDIANSFEVLIINNGPQSTLSMIKKSFPTVKIINSRKNVGYTGAVNRGYCLSKSAFLVVLNNDVILEKNCLAQLISCLQQSPEVGICVPIKYSLRNPNIIDGAGGTMNLLLQAWDFCNFERRSEECSGLKIVAYPSGAAYAIRREIVDLYGYLLDDDFFMYFDDPDIGIRSFFAGYATMLVPSSVVYHRRGETSGRFAPFSYFYFSRNMLLFLFKNFDTSTFLKLLVNYTVYWFLRAFNVCLFLKSKAAMQISSMITGTFSGLLDLGVIKQKRSHVQWTKNNHETRDYDYLRMFSDEIPIIIKSTHKKWFILRGVELLVRFVNGYSKLVKIDAPKISKIRIVCEEKRRIYSLR